MGLSIVLDTNVSIYHLKDLLGPPFGIGIFAVSIITQIELLSLPGLTPTDEAAIRRMLAQDVEVIPLTEPIVPRTIALRRAHRLKLPDAVIAATALELGYELMTNDAALATGDAENDLSGLSLPCPFLSPE